jgi:hypothetical protein
MRKALWFAEMAVQFNPESRAAIELRSDIWLNKPYEPHPASAQRDVQLTIPPNSPNPLEGESMPDWLMQDLENAPAENAIPAAHVPMHPLDPGVPGRRRDIVRPKVLE